MDFVLYGMILSYGNLDRENAGRQMIAPKACPQVPVLFIDCQTSGASPATSHLLEVAWQIDRDGEQQASAEVHSAIVCLPGGCDLTKRITALTGISAEDMGRAIPAEQVAKRLRDSVWEVQAAGGFAVIHFARFEKVFLDRLWSDCFEGETFSLPVICTHQLTRRLFPEFSSHGLRAVSGFFGKTMVDLKRATSNVEATRVVWEGILPTLCERQLLSREELANFCATKHSRGKISREYRIPKEKRLQLPSQPGVYTYLGKNGAVLYIGKATSLKQRVNSYFRRRQGGDSRKNEMLMQAWDLRTETQATPLEAALREFNLIQELSPPYNRALRRKPSDFVFLNQNLTCSVEVRETERTSLLTGPEFSYGPVDDRYGLRDFLALTTWLRGNLKSNAMAESSVPPELDRVFFGLGDSTPIREGYEDFCELAAIDAEDKIDSRLLLTVGLKLLREKWQRVQAEAEAGTLFLKPPAAGEEASQDDDSDSKEVDPVKDPEEAEEHVWTREEVAEKIPRILRRAALGWLETLWLKRLFQVEIRFKSKNAKAWRILHIENGAIAEGLNFQPVCPDWTPLGLARFRTIVQELRRVLAKGGSVEVKPAVGPPLTGLKLEALLAMGF